MNHSDITSPTFMQRLFSYRGIAGLLTLASMIGMSYAFFYLQKTLQLEPCPLCIFQRLGLIEMGIFTFFAFLLDPKSVKLRIFLMIGALLGMLWSIVVAIRHVWLQHLPPDEVPSCGPGLDYWMNTLPIAQVFKEVFRGSGECAAIDWTLLGFSIPEMSLLFFSVLAVMIIVAIVKANSIGR